MMQERTNDLFEVIVNEGLVISKLKGIKEAEYMMKEAGIPHPVIERVLLSPARLRSSDWH